MTGFAVSVEGRVRYLLVFREVTDRTTARFAVDGITADLRASLLASNAPASLTLETSAATVTFNSPRTYAWFELE